jgi:hypothetical protein
MKIGIFGTALFASLLALSASHAATYSDEYDLSGPGAYEISPYNSSLGYLNDIVITLSTIDRISFDVFIPSGHADIGGFSIDHIQRFLLPDTGFNIGPHFATAQNFNPVNGPQTIEVSHTFTTTPIPDEIVYPGTFSKFLGTNSLVFYLVGNVSAFPSFNNSPEISLSNISLTSLAHLTVTFRYGDPIPAPVPEPSTWALALIGFGLLGTSLRIRRRHLPPGALVAYPVSEKEAHRTPTRIRSGYRPGPSSVPGQFFQRRHS